MADLFNEASSYTQYSPKMKREVIKDWKLLFPDMNQIKPNHMCLHKIVGPLLITLDFSMTKGSYDYQPRFYVYNLAIESDFISIGALDTILYGENKPLYAIQANRHKELYAMAGEKLKEKTYNFLCNTKYDLSEVIDAFKDHILNYKKNELQNELAYLPLTAAWAGDIKQTNELLTWGATQPEAINRSNLSGLGGRSDWINVVGKLIEHPNKLKEISTNNIKKYNLEKIPFQNFVA